MQESTFHETDQHLKFFYIFIKIAEQLQKVNIFSHEKMIYRYFFIFLFLCVGCFPVYAQKANKKPPTFTPTEIWRSGLPYTQNFLPKDYNGNAQNWGFVKGNNGIMYVANSHGVLEYDGTNWRSTVLSNNSIVNSIAKSSDGTIYVGGYGEFGYLERNSIGQLIYHSLSENIEKSFSKFTRINSIISVNNTVYFITSDFLFRWDGKDFKIWKPKNRFGDIYVVNGNIYVTSKGEGILELKDEDLITIPNGNYFSYSKGGRIMMIEPLESNKLLIGHSTQGLFIYDGENFSIYSPNIQEVFKKNSIYGGTQLQNGDYAIKTINSGVYIIDQSKRNVTRRYGVKNGLLSDVVYSVYGDANGNLWVGSDKGITIMNLMSSFRKFKHFPERIRSITYDSENLFIASRGVYQLTKKSTNNFFIEPEFKKIKGFDETVRFIIPVNSHKLVIQNSKVFDLDKNNNVTLIRNKELHRYAIKSKISPNTVYASTQDGYLKKYTLPQDKWTSSNITKIQDEITKITESPNGDLWLSTYYNGVYRLKNNKENVKEYLKPTHYDTISKLPSMSYNFVFVLNKKVYLSNQEKGIFIFNNKTQTFLKDTILMNQFIKEEVELYGPIGEGFGGRVWQTVDADQTNKIYNYNEKKITEIKDYQIFDDFKTYNISTIDGIVMFSGPDGMLAYNKKSEKVKKPLHAVQIRKVFLKNDSLVYAGKNATSEYSFRYKQNAVQFEYSLPYYTKSEKNEYQYILEGFDDSWSSWRKETKKNYTNIPEGTYTFKVRAKNIFSEISKEDSYVFTVLPPWYRTWWAYLIYVLGAVFTILLFSQWRSQQLRSKNLALERIVANRTEEISEKNVQLESQTERLKELDTMKTRLFANISHEFRTPLTLIKGPIEKLEEAQKNTISTSNIKMIRRNANRLLNLVNQLLDLSKLDSGKLQLNVAEGDVFKCIRTAASAFGSHAASRNIDYRIKIPSRPLWGSFDRDKLENIIYNLLSNAFKFTADEGKIGITASFRHNRLELKVSDTGTGIAAEKLPHIYDRFFQVDDSYTKEKAGSGIGLALTKELVQLMNGKIYVESELGRGTHFKVLMPIGEIKSYQKETIQKKPITIFENEHEKPASTISNKRSTNILIIEDNNDMRHFIREQLIQDYDIFEASNGKEGLKKATKLMPDLIITDLMMPQMDGITLCKKLKTNLTTSHIPVIMLTAKAGIENKLEGLETGADDYLTKPFNAKELQVRTKNLIAQRQHLRELFSKNPTLDPQEITVTSLDEKFLQQLLELLEEKHLDAEFGVLQMQKQLGMGKTQLHTKTKALTDQPPGELLRNFRLKRAAQLLSKNAENISQIAYSVGFNSLSYFTRCFKEHYGMSPSKFIKKDSSNT